ncbi:hypothetical protein QTP70_025529 [Hemibagrus guttatus]|uniref:Uncharacterized protein n=1 Tax=Hemibagrus guttatus TaxID=175788 RepID=A0AAE0RHS3_9TELE|nr:hypothetical protein QTP70_025529 [Hemibagrus guttatus]
MLEHGVCYGQAVTSTEVQQQDTTRVQIRGAVPPNHAPPGITVVAHMGVEVPQQNYGDPSRSTFQHPSQGLQEGWCGLPSLEECKDLAEETYSQGEILKAVKYQLLSPEPEKALPIGIAFIKEQLSCPDWTVDSVYPVLDLLSYIRTDRLVLTKCSEERNELLILCGYIGALLAIGRQYSSIVPALYEYTRRMVYMVFKEGKVTPVFLSDRGKKQLSLLWSFSLRLQFGHLRKAPEWLLHQNRQSEPQAQPAVQKPTGATTTPEELCAAEPVTVRSCSAELVSVRPGEIERDQEKPCLTEPGLERPCSVDSGAVLELPVLAEAGTEVQSCRLQAPITTPVHGDGEDAEMEDEPTENCFSERSGAQIVEESFLKDLPKLSEQVARELDGELTLAELHKALQGMENGRAPAYADDLVVMMDSQKDVNVLTDILNDFQVLSSAKVNWAKSEAILVGEWGREQTTLPGGLLWKKGSFKYLGVYLGNNEFLNKLGRHCRACERQTEQVEVAGPKDVLQGVNTGHHQPSRVVPLHACMRGSAAKPAGKHPGPASGLLLGWSTLDSAECPSPAQRRSQLLKRREVDLPLQIEQLSVELEAWRACTHSLNKGAEEMPYTSPTEAQRAEYTILLSRMRVEPLKGLQGPDYVTGSVLPSHSDVQISCFTGLRIQASHTHTQTHTSVFVWFTEEEIKVGPVFFLEDGKSSISLNDALMWAKVNPFSPLGTGIRLNPF